MRVLVFEPDHEGHHFAYLSCMLPALRALAPDTVLVISSAAAATEPYRLLIRPLEGSIAIDPSARYDGSASWAEARGRADDLLAAVARHRPDHVIVPYADGVSQALGLRATSGRRVFPRGVTAEALYFRGGFAYPTRGLKRRVFTRLSWELGRRAPFTHFHHLDPLVLERAPSPRWSLMPDPVERPAPLTTHDARERLGVPVEGRCIGCAGAIDSRKGADLLIAAFERAGPGALDRLLLIGPHAPDIRALLSGPYAGAVRAGRIVSLDRFLPPEDLASSLMAMDVVCTPYPSHIGSASIVIRAAAAGRPVLGSDFGWVGRTVDQFALGWTCGVNNQQRFADTIRESLSRASDWKPGPSSERFVRFHSPENFAKAWCVCLRRRLGLPAEAGTLTWDWVLGGADGKSDQGRTEGV